MIWKAPARGERRSGPTLFLDRDGVLIVDKDYLRDPAGVELVPLTQVLVSRESMVAVVDVAFANVPSQPRMRKLARV